MALRLGGCALLLWALRLPLLQTQHGQPVPTRLAVVVDDSASMARPAAGGRGAGAVPDGEARHDTGVNAQAVADTRAARAAAWVQALRPQAPAPLQLTLHNLAGPCPDAARCSTPAASRSPLLQALLQAAEASPTPLAGLVLVSDGAANDVAVDGNGRLAAEVQAQLAALQVPLHTVALGDPAHVDLLVDAVITGDYAFVKSTTDVTCQVRAQAPTPRQVEVELLEDGQPQGRQTLQLTPTRPRGEAHFSRRYDAVGERLLACRIVAHADEVDTANNVRAAVLPVLRDKIRVLHVVGRPSWDERYLRQELKDNRNVELVSFFILRTPDDDTSVPESELSLIPFPVARLFTSELKNFDVVVLQNFDARPFQMVQYLPNLRDAVQQGLGLVMLGGAESFAEAGYAGTPLASVLPVALPASAGAASGVAAASGPWQVRPTPAAAFHPLTQGSLQHGADPAARPGPLADAAAAALAPPVRGLNAAGAPLPQAQLLWQAQGQTAADVQPLLASREVGRGRSVALLTDGLWRWRYAPQGHGPAAQAYVALWQNMLRWLTHDPALGRLHLAPAQRAFASDEPGSLGGATLTGSLRALGDDWQPSPGAEVRLTLRRHPHDPGAGPAQAAATPPRTQTLRLGDDGRVDWTLPDVPPGVWRLQATRLVAAGLGGPGGPGDAALAGPAADTSEVTLVVHLPAEQVDTAPNARLLAALAQAGGGSHLAPSTWPARAVPLRLAPPPPPQVTAQSERPAFALAAVLAAFCLSWGGAAWLARRRGGR